MTDITIRQAVRDDARTIAELFRIATEGVSDYIWNGLRDDDPDRDLLQIGAARFARENTDFSYRNCLIADAGGIPAGMIHAYVMEGDGTVADDCDPVMRPYAELETAGSLYVSGIGVYAAHRGREIGTKLMRAVAERARRLDSPSISLIVFAENEDGLRFYRRLGFVERDRRRIVEHEMIKPTGDAILVEWPLG